MSDSGSGSFSYCKTGNGEYKIQINELTHDVRNEQLDEVYSETESEDPTYVDKDNTSSFKSFITNSFYSKLINRDLFIHIVILIGIFIGACTFNMFRCIPYFSIMFVLYRIFKVSYWKSSIYVGITMLILGVIFIPYSMYSTEYIISSICIVNVPIITYKIINLLIDRV